MRTERIENDHFPDVRGLYSSVFNEELSQELWEWKYGDHRGCSMGVWKDNVLVGHYGGIKREVLFSGSPKTALQIADVMVEASGRQGLSRKGAFYQSASKLYEDFVGHDKPFFQAFGFPNDRAMRIAEKLGFYQEVDRITVLNYPAVKSLAGYLLKGETLAADADKKTLGILGQLWENMSEDLCRSVIGVRSRDYLEYRYFQRPDRDYRVILVYHQLRRRYVGCVVCRPENGNLFLLDLIAPVANIPIIIRFVTFYAYCNGLKSVKVWITKSHSNYFPPARRCPEGDEVVVPAQTWTDGVSPDLLRNRWWLTAGDTDFL